MKIAIASDHAGFCLKEEIRSYLAKKKLIPRDFGTFSSEPCDYPYFAKKVARVVSSGSFKKGILICGSGIGMCIAANKVKKIRAVVCEEPETAEISRLHNDSNILCIGSRKVSSKKAFKIIDTWLKTPFEGGRHKRRVRAIG